MKGNLYGTGRTASMNPKMFMIQALRKLLLNNANIIKFDKEDAFKNDREKLIRFRIANSIALIDEMKLGLNKEEENTAVQEVDQYFDWIIKELEEIEDVVLGRTEELKEELSVKLGNLDYIIQNILEGFEGIE